MSGFWKGKKVLLTGHTGFKGSWLSIWLKSMGADIVGVSIAPPTTKNLFEEANVALGMRSIHCDVRDKEKLKDIFREEMPEIVFHLAAQPLVRYSYRNPVETYETNVMGSLNILESIRFAGSVRSVVMVTTDKCYENKEWCWGYREDEPMGGFDPYSSSKACAELLTASYRNSYFHPDKYSEHQTAIATVRAGNVIGGGDWAQDRLLPDMIKSFELNEVVNIRNPFSIRPWQHVLEPLAGYMCLAQKMYDNGSEFSEAWNFGPLDEDSKSVAWIADRMVSLWGEGRWQKEGGAEKVHEASYLKLDCSKAKARLGWASVWNLNEALVKIVDWHKRAASGEDLNDVCLEQINLYLNDVVDVN